MVKKKAKLMGLGKAPLILPFELELKSAAYSAGLTKKAVERDLGSCSARKKGLGLMKLRAVHSVAKRVMAAH